MIGLNARFKSCQIAEVSGDGWQSVWRNRDKTVLDRSAASFHVILLSRS